MDSPVTLLHGDEAARFIERIDDPITKNLTNMAFVHLIKNHYVERRPAPSNDLDLLYVVAALKDFFAEHDVIARTLAGETVGAFFDESDDAGTLGIGPVTVIA